MHARIHGTTPSGEPYTALDAGLLDWVQATAAYGFLTAYDRFVEPVCEADKVRFYEEAGPVAQLYGVSKPVRSPANFDARLKQRLPCFEPHPINTEFLAIIKTGSAVRAVPKSLQSSLANASVSILPPAVRDILQLGPDYDLSPMARTALQSAGKLASRIPVPRSPPADAATRLDLPWSFAWKSHEAQQRILRDKAKAGTPVSTLPGTAGE